MDTTQFLFSCNIILYFKRECKRFYSVYILFSSFFLPLHSLFTDKKSKNKSCSILRGWGLSDTVQICWSVFPWTSSSTTTCSKCQNHTSFVLNCQFQSLARLFVRTAVWLQLYTAGWWRSFTESLIGESRYIEYWLLVTRLPAFYVCIVGCRGLSQIKLLSAQLPLS